MSDVARDLLIDILVAAAIGALSVSLMFTQNIQRQRQQGQPIITANPETSDNSNPD